ncbi:hypothetical protein AK812_SmicGene39548 [Symbiodinium microadriaticum]|uniref:Uncharacterized protein n=1 Tax=Symbiodinium microadriaticum TaxID=2951 RepID=A0A1Q9CAY0_SYMMI|nr:hypothetical protein AK812_SmicGene39548 [Symbiodinium microadriaticum]
MSTPPTEQPGDALLQQGMSPTYQDEDRVPAQGDAAPDPLRHDREVPPPGMTRTLLNGTPPDSGIAAPRSEMELPVLASGNEGNMASQDRAREISAEGTVPMAGVTAPPLTTSSQAGLSLPLFQNFVPSPLPGQSPVAQQQGGTRLDSYENSLRSTRRENVKFELAILAPHRGFRLFRVASLELPPESLRIILYLVP